MSTEAPTSTRRLTTGLIAVLAILGGSCGSDGGGAEAPEPTPAVTNTATQPPPATAAASSTSTNVATTTTSTTTATTTTTSTTTTVAPTTTTADTTPSGATPPVIDLEASTIGGYRPLAAAESLVDDFTAALGTPTRDLQWLPMPPKLVCTGNREYRDVTWGDLRIVLERDGGDDSTPIMGSWSLGEGYPIAPPRRPGGPDISPVGVTTVDGVGIGTHVDAITSVAVQASGDDYVVIGVTPVVISVDGDAISGFHSGRLDCLDPALSRIPCDVAIPIGELPDGTPTAAATFDEGAAFWGVATAGPDGQNVVSQVLAGPDPDDAANARSAPIGARIPPLDVRVVPTADPPVGGSTFYVFDDTSDCVRLLRVGPGLDVSELEAYATTLAETLEPRR